jgi:hypothetical protein
MWLQNEKYVVTYRKKKGRAFVVLKEDAQPADVLRAAFQVRVACLKCSQ